MEHACEQCGVMVEDGVPFCFQCSAPQIRVRMAQRPLRVEGAYGPWNVEPGSAPPPPPPLPYQRSFGGLIWPQAWRSILLPGLLLVLGLGLPIVPPIIVTVAAGSLAAVLYGRRLPEAVNPATGAKLGMLAAFMGWFVYALAIAAQYAAGVQGFVTALRQGLREAATRFPGQGTQDLIELTNTPNGMLMVILLVLAMLLAIMLGCSALGGAVAGALIQRRQRPKPGA